MYVRLYFSKSANKRLYSNKIWEKLKDTKIQISEKLNNASKLNIKDLPFNKNMLSEVFNKLLTNKNITIKQTVIHTLNKNKTLLMQKIAIKLLKWICCILFLCCIIFMLSKLLANDIYNSLIILHYLNI